MLRDQTKGDAETRIAFDDFMREVEPGLRRALTAAFGDPAGREATVDALAYGWQHWDRIGAMANPAGYLYRVGHRAALRDRPRSGPSTAVDPASERWFEPELTPALRRLPERQRVVVALIHAFDWTFSEVADFLGVSKASVQTHERRAMRRLKRELGVDR